MQQTLPQNGLVYFGTMACGHGYNQNLLINELKEKLPVIIPGEKELESWSQELGLTQSPAWVIIKNGQVCDKFIGFLEKEQILTIVNYYFRK